MLYKISSLISNKNNQPNANLLSVSELELVEKSFIYVRLLGVEKGNMESFSLIYSYSAKKERKDDHAKSIIGKIINDHRQEVVNEINEENQQGIKKLTFNRLLKSKYNKYNLLVREKSFEKYETEKQNQKDIQTPIGFICRSNFTLSNGKFSGNGFILTKCLINMIKSEQKSNKVLYIPPSSHRKFKTAKITNIFFK